MPGLYIITGSNGAGKSTVGANYLPSYIQQQCTIFDGDKLFMNKQRSYGRRALKLLKKQKNWLLLLLKKLLIHSLRKLYQKVPTLFTKDILQMKRLGRYPGNLKLRASLST